MSADETAPACSSDDKQADDPVVESSSTSSASSSDDQPARDDQPATDQQSTTDQQSSTDQQSTTDQQSSTDNQPSTAAKDDSQPKPSGAVGNGATCARFVPHLFKKGVCNICFADAASHPAPPADETEELAARRAEPAKVAHRLSEATISVFLPPSSSPAVATTKEPALQREGSKISPATLAAFLPKESAPSSPPSRRLSSKPPVTPSPPGSTDESEQQQLDAAPPPPASYESSDDTDSLTSPRSVPEPPSSDLGVDETPGEVFEPGAYEEGSFEYGIFDADSFYGEADGGQAEGEYVDYYYDTTDDYVEPPPIELPTGPPPPVADRVRPSPSSAPPSDEPPSPPGLRKSTSTSTMTTATATPPPPLSPRKSTSTSTLAPLSPRAAAEPAPRLLQMPADVVLPPAPPPPMSTDDVEAVKAERTRMIATELLSTEESYVSGLGSLLSTFILPMRECGLPEEHHRELGRVFSMVETLSNFHGTVLDMLRQRMANWQTGKTGLGGVFKSLVPYMKLYVQFVNNYTLSLEQLAGLYRNRRFSRLLKAIAAGRVAPSSDQIELNNLRSLLVTPIQRIPRYTLLLKDLLENTPVENEDHASLAEAYREVTNLAEYINEQKRKDESSRRLNQVTSRLRGDLSQFRQSVLDPNALDLDRFKDLRAHTWHRKQWSAPVWCFFCNKLIYDGFGNFKGTICKVCKFPAHRPCAHKVPRSCGLLKNMKESLLQHNRTLISELRDMEYQRLLPLEIEQHNSAVSMPYVNCSVFVFNDSMVVIETANSVRPSSSSSSSSADVSEKIRYSVLCMIRWHSHMTNRRVQLKLSDDEPVISIVPPRESDVTHTFRFEDAARRQEVFALLSDLVDKYFRENEENSERQQKIKKEKMATLHRKASAASLDAHAIRKAPSMSDMSDAMQVPASSSSPSPSSAAAATGSSSSGAGKESEKMVRSTSISKLLHRGIKPPAPSMQKSKSSLDNVDFEKIDQEEKKKKGTGGHRFGKK